MIKARNEQENIEKTLLALKHQSIKPSQIIIVDDGSTDRTREIAEKYADIVVSLPYHEDSFIGRPELAAVINAGLEKVKNNVDYVVICDADHALEEKYVEAVLKRMEENPKVVVASGRIRGETFSETHPRGSGRIVNAHFWRKVNGLRYPVKWGWEGWICVKAMQLGYLSRCFHDVETKIQRPTRYDSNKMKLWGKAMYALGYDWKYVLIRSIRLFLKNPTAGINMFAGWLMHEDVEKLDIAEYFNTIQKKRFWRRIVQLIKNRQMIKRMLFSS